ncbi:Phosphoribosyl-ATP pyrophosphohydrolase-domain containing protein (two domains) [Cotonvirus japonicus]|uniref:Phosphoribosyl-ATP pyrophosphohydrolase-domain containing protein (Two domains) n=1 Tax=Cotonvirus japonicus TaxID=2811091 RepID=A0ABM7NSI8_9VIRU|nr:Phosphoribosyl-ATP pyrophosphohydrolase-domain containing protein (two domains) [Cotonvirus japonicus]BCS83057.1 Phosphoribosyl-ATP pyrophosphohydrolase-domain containing protein (two domains) [Cotonvirus japonicus]
MSIITNFERVGEFHEVFGHPKFNTLQLDVINDSKLMKFRLDLIREEYRELQDAVNMNDRKEIIDALGDILYVSYGMAQVMGINIDNIIKEIISRILFESSTSHTEDLMSSVSNFNMIGMSHDEVDKQNFKITNKFDTETLNKQSNNINKFVGIIGKEFDSLTLFVEKRNLFRIISCLSYLIIKTYSLGYIINVDLDDVFTRVHNSNMSKLCENEEQAIDTIEHYKTLQGFENVNIAYRKSVDDKRYVIYNVETGKILKSKYFVLPNFDDIISEVKNDHINNANNVINVINV